MKSADFVKVFSTVEITLDDAIALYYPPGRIQLNGEYKDNGEVAKGIIEAIRDGRDVMIPNTREANGDARWQIVVLKGAAKKREEGGDAD